MSWAKLNILTGFAVTCVGVGLVLLYTWRVGHLPSVGGELFDDFDTEEFSNWEFDSDTGCEFSVVVNPQGSGNVLRIDAPAGARCELLPILRTSVLGKLGHEPRRQLVRYGFKTYLGKEESLVQRNEILAQWHGQPDKYFGEEGARGPALALRVMNGKESLTATSDSSFLSEQGRNDARIWSGDLSQGVWVDWSFEVLWSYGDDGYLKVIRNGSEIVELYGPNSFNDLRNVYLKIGIYHPGTNRTAYFDEFRFESL